MVKRIIALLASTSALSVLIGVVFLACSGGASEVGCSDDATCVSAGHLCCGGATCQDSYDKCNGRADGDVCFNGAECASGVCSFAPCCVCCELTCGVKPETSCCSMGGGCATVPCCGGLACQAIGDMGCAEGVCLQ
jgi:hypothetical protein